jgi:hypothetical protein
MDVLKTLTSPAFQQEIDNALELSRTNDDREVGFHCWTDGTKLTINQPALGGPDSINNHIQTEVMYDPGTGFNVGQGGEVVVFFHTHPLVEDDRRLMLAPSISDLIVLAGEAHQNFELAGLYDRESWNNPIGVIGSARRPEHLSIFQVQTEVISDPTFNIPVPYPVACHAGSFGGG